MWLAAPEFHPLLRSGEESPVAWINAGMKTQNVSVGFMPFDLDAGGKWLRWRTEDELHP
jgi:hypothetical protein